jgi:hypothetical protein
MSFGMEWSWGGEWWLRAALAMGWLWALGRLLASRGNRAWIRGMTLLALLAALPWCWHGGSEGREWALWKAGGIGTTQAWIIAWATGATVMLLRRGAGWLRIRSWCRNGMSGEEAGAWRAAWNHAASRAGVEADVVVRVIPGLRSPAVWVGRRVWLLVPAHAAGWSDEVCRRVCLHEAGHVAGGDAWLHRVWMVVDVLQWWNPLWWGLRARMELELEKLADGWVLRGDRGGAREYVRDLLDCVESGMKGVASWGGSGGLEERINCLLRPYRAGSGWGAWVAMILAGVSVVGLAVLFRGPAPARMDAAVVRDAEWRMAANPFPAAGEGD